MPALSPMYIAGFFDGEGYLTMRRSNKYLRSTPSYRIVIGLVNNGLEVLQEMQQVIGGRIYTKTKKNKKARQGFELVLVRNEDIAHFIELIGPHIFHKARQIKLAQEFLALGKMKKEGVWPRFVAAEGEVAMREAFKTQLGELNCRGVACQH